MHLIRLVYGRPADGWTGPNRVSKAKLSLNDIYEKVPYIAFMCRDPPATPDAEEQKWFFMVN